MQLITTSYSTSADKPEVVFYAHLWVTWITALLPQINQNIKIWHIHLQQSTCGCLQILDYFFPSGQKEDNELNKLFLKNWL